MKEKIILVGGGGHCKSCIDVIEQEYKYEIYGIIVTSENVGKRVLGYPIIGTDEDILNFVSECNNFLVTIGQIKTAKVRERVVYNLSSFDVKFPVIISPYAYVSPHSHIGAGTIVMHNVVVNAGVNIGGHCIVNTKALLEHDVQAGEFCHISTGARLNGEVQVGSYSFIGSNTVINQKVKIPNYVVIGSGSTVTRKEHIEEYGVYAGNYLRRVNTK